MTEEQLAAVQDAEAWADELIAEILEPGDGHQAGAGPVAATSPDPDSPPPPPVEDPSGPEALAPVIPLRRKADRDRLPSEVAYIFGPEAAFEAEDTPPPLPGMVPSASADVIPARRPWWRGVRVAIALGVVSGLLAVGGAGVSYAAIDYGNDYDGVMFPGTTIAGVDVAGMDRDQALAAVRAAIGPQLEREITLRWRQKTWKVTPAKLGAVGNAEAVVDAALAAGADTEFIDRARMRIFGDGLGYEQDVAITYPREGVGAFIEGLAASIDRPARDASFDYSTGWIEYVREQVGIKVKVKASSSALMGALENGASTAPMSIRAQIPQVQIADFDKVLLLRIGENKLYLYDDGKIIREWLVAPGTASYPTPQGQFEITEKRYMPTWVNPAPDGWGANMPASIGPGYGNPLGLRALNWSAPAIRFHGTSAVSSLGTNASHGCVRMANEDVIELYDLVEVGTPIISIQVAPYR